MAKNNKAATKRSKDTGAVTNELKGITNVLIVLDRDTLTIEPYMVSYNGSTTLKVFGRPVKKDCWCKRVWTNIKRWFNR